MGGKGGGGDGGGMQPVQSTIDTRVSPLDLSQEQEAIDVQKAARDATAPPPQPTGGAPGGGTTTGDVAASTLDVPDFLTGQHSLQPTSTKKSKLVTTDDTKAPSSGSV